MSSNERGGRRTNNRWGEKLRVKGKWNGRDQKSKFSVVQGKEVCGSGRNLGGRI